MSLAALPHESEEKEAVLVARARQGDRSAFAELAAPWRKPLYAYIYRMVTLRQDAEDLLQDVMVRALEALRDFRGEARFKSWLFAIATHACLDHLRKKKRWRTEAQLLGEQGALASPEISERLRSVVAAPDFVYEIREHIAFCFSCIGRTLPPEGQAALLLREVFGFSNEESAQIAGLSEPAFRHRLAAARAEMIRSFDGLCRLVSKTGACWQCAGLREWTPEKNRGADLVSIQVAPGVAVNAENLLDARIEIVREADLEKGGSRTMHEWFYENLTRQEEGAAAEQAASG